MTFTPEDLEKAVKELAFDVYHFRCYRRVYGPWSREHSEITAAQAALSSLLLHFRVLLGFFYKRPKDDDCVVWHFKTFPEFAERFPPDLHEWSEVKYLLQHLDKRLAHFTETRWKEEPPPMNYYDPYILRVEVLLVQFEAALPDKLQQVFRRWLRYWESKHPIPQKGGRATSGV
jgi:hypothetical protein